MTLTSQIAGMVSNVSYADLPKDVIEKTKLLILDHLGCMIAGSVDEEAGRLRTYLEKGDPGGASLVWGTSRRMIPGNAAHANAQAGTVLSLDDSFIRYGHPGNSLLPAALAVAQQVNATGSELIAATVCGYEMSMRLAFAITASAERDQQVKGYASWGAFGAATAAARLHQLPTDKIASCYGMTALHAPPPFLRKFYGRPMNWLKNNYGWANRAGITGVDLVIAGFEGNRTIFDGDHGYWVMAGSDQFDPDQLLIPFDERMIVREIGFKPYSGCRWSHTSIDCVRSIINEHGIGAGDVERITIETADEFVRDLNSDVWPETTLGAILNIPYLVALELHGKSSELGLAKEDLKRGDIIQTVEKISMIGLAGAQEKFFKCSMLPVEITVYTKDGRELRESAEYPGGHPKGPVFGPEEVKGKFLKLSTPVIGEDRAKDICAKALALERYKLGDLAA